MKRPAIALLGLLACALAVGAERSSAQRGAFVRENPCPATGERRGACPGYVVDHIQPLCDGGPDHPGNMQWQTVDEAKRKDKEEWKVCRDRRRREAAPVADR